MITPLVSLEGQVFGVDNFSVQVRAPAGSPDAGTVRFKFTTDGVVEGDTIFIEVERVNGGAGRITVIAEVGGGSATVGGDYSPIGTAPSNFAQIVWSDGEEASKFVKFKSTQDQR